MSRLTLALLMTAMLASPAASQRIPDRTFLDALLEGRGRTEDFSDLSQARQTVSQGNFYRFTVRPTSPLLFQGWGCGFSVDATLGIGFNTYPCATDPTQDPVFTRYMEIVFRGGTSAFGLDMLVLQTQLFGHVTVLDRQGQVLADDQLPNPSNGYEEYRTFYGYQSTGGIGSVRIWSLGGASTDYTSFANDITSNTVTPEPFSLTLLGTGLFGLGAAALRRRKQRAAPEP